MQPYSEVLRKRRMRESKRMNEDLAWRIKEKTRKQLYNLIRGTSKRSECLVGCSWIELRSHLESQFTDNMNWGNYGRQGWVVDHKRPIASFNLLDLLQLKECFHYKNLQPLWLKHNSAKGSLFNNKRYKHADHINS
jgi:hypothetical protein